MTSFENTRVWFVTGSSQGLGKAIVEVVLSHGDRVVATMRNPASLSSLQSKYPSEQLLLQRLDVGSPEEIEAAFEATKKHFNRLDVVVNNAGYGLYGEIEATPDHEARAIFEVLFWGPVNITKQGCILAIYGAFFREVNPQGHGGRVFNISSSGGYMAQPNLSFYGSAKFALEGFTQSFIKEMPPVWNITGCIIEPGGFRTEWAGASMNTLPQHPAYTDPSFPTSQYRVFYDVATSKSLGETSRAGEVLYKLAYDSFAGTVLPLRLQLGSDSFYMAQAQARKALTDQDVWGEVSHSTNADDHDKGLVEMVKKMFANA
ncbi:hypothetical protein M422DRAFT_211950 [Sphaerobolus stellatus SS14]|uniref:NAD(P)-binding protein n=1 Tax=Sphaerobolus stellatus (strain SS14) TaxID=990650 RepID=A0A0C9VH62_SPHS4|nr:hypothetical protein M422DRAFT_211950 [Sphaerobolus stellatus SS14]